MTADHHPPLFPDAIPTADDFRLDRADVHKELAALFAAVGPNLSLVPSVATVFPPEITGGIGALIGRFNVLAAQAGIIFVTDYQGDLSDPAVTKAGIFVATDTPEGHQSAPAGSLAVRVDQAGVEIPRLYVKQTGDGTTNSGWALAAIERKLTVVLDNTKLLSIKGTPYTDVIPAPGSGKFISIKKLISKFVPGTTPYTVPASASLIFGAGVVGGAILFLTGVADQTTTKIGIGITFEMAAMALQLPGSTTLPIDPAALDNQPMEITGEANSAELTLGDGTIICDITYTIEDIPTAMI